MSIMLRNVGHELLSARVGLLRVPNSVYSPTAIDLRATGFAAPVLRATPDPITFDDTVVGSARITTISVGNPGAVSVPIGTINLQATGDCRIVRDKCAGVTLDVGETCRVEVAFQPTATGATATALEISGPASPLMRQLPRPGRGLPRFEAMCHCFPLFHSFPSYNCLGYVGGVCGNLRPMEPDPRTSSSGRRVVRICMPTSRPTGAAQLLGSHLRKPREDGTCGTSREEGVTPGPCRLCIQHVPGVLDIRALRTALPLRTAQPVRVAVDRH